jgi:PAS domain S-box-containing protein
MTIVALSLLLAAAVLFSSGLWVLINSPKRQLTRLFFLLCLLGAMWVFNLYEESRAATEIVGFWVVFESAWLWIFPLQFHFLYRFSETDKTPSHRNFIFLTYLVTIVISWLFSRPDRASIWLLSWPLFLALASQVLAISEYRLQSANRKREQELLVLVGVSIGLIFCIGMALNQILELGFDFVIPVILAVESLLIAIALVRHELIQLTPFTATESIMATLTDAVILTTSGGLIVTANRAALDILGYNEIEMIDQPIGSVVGQVWKGDFMPGEDDFGIEMALIAKDTTRIPVTLSTSVVAKTAASPQGVVFVARDLTKRVHAQEQLINALKEKEILLKETHHRVKNNLQVISSLLSIQTDYVVDVQARRVLEESRNRVFSMAVVHELLYQSENLREIGFKDYIDRLIEHIIFSHNVSPDKITFEVNISEITFDLDTASYIGLVINELIVNALVHGFPKGRTGAIWLDLAHQDEGKYLLTVRDNGVGLPPDFNLQESESLGLQLVSMIAEQIEGDLVIDQGEETSFELTFCRLDEESDG